MSPPHTPPFSVARATRGLQSVVAVAAAVLLTATAGPTGQTPRPPASAVALLAADPVDIAQGISITPAPGWTVGDRGPDWVALSNADSSAQLQVVVKTADGTDVVAALQGDIDQLTGNPSSDLTNVRNLTDPLITMLQGNHFQQKAAVDYTADLSSPRGTVPVLGTFGELLNTSTRLSAFIDFRQNDNATGQAAQDGGAMIDSML
ncbi:hypothetical protein [Mycobacterium sp. Lab-001]|uniref:hypothetical protein n=1 Tax=Mycobacterium sp. Lab-001 TaxID=3410136 RepID=UPI003D17E037